MKGVEILTAHEVATEFGFNWKLCLALVAAGVVVGCISGIVAKCLSLDNSWGDFVVTLISAVIICTILGVCHSQFTAPMPVCYETEYQVTVSDEVSMNDFMEKYEIIEQDGKIYTVRERD